MRIAITGAVLAGIVLAPAGASAAIRFDPATNTGFVDRLDVQKAFGWDDATLLANAAGLHFTSHLTKEAVYSVVCDRHPPAEVRTNPGSESAGLHTIIARDATTGVITGFRLAGASSGSSSMNVQPEVGGPCMTGAGKLTRVTHLSTTVTKALSVEFGDEQRYLAESAGVSTAPPDTH